MCEVIYQSRLNQAPIHGVSLLTDWQKAGCETVIHYQYHHVFFIVVVVSVISTVTSCLLLLWSLSSLSHLVCCCYSHCCWYCFFSFFFLSCLFILGHIGRPVAIYIIQIAEKGGKGMDITQSLLPCGGILLWYNLLLSLSLNLFGLSLTNSPLLYKNILTFSIVFSWFLLTKSHKTSQYLPFGILYY
jgi:hypothetical protein